MPDKRTDNWLKEIRQKISCPQLGDDHYGEWGILTKNQRFTIKRMLDYIESQEQYINCLQAENKNLQERNVILRGLVDTQKAENERLNLENSQMIANIKGLKKLYETYPEDEEASALYLINKINEIVKETKGNNDE